MATPYDSGGRGDSSNRGSTGSQCFLGPLAAFALGLAAASMYLVQSETTKGWRPAGAPASTSLVARARSSLLYTQQYRFTSSSGSSRIWSESVAFLARLALGVAAPRLRGRAGARARTHTHRRARAQSQSQCLMSLTSSNQRGPRVGGGGGAGWGGGHEHQSAGKQRRFNRERSRTVFCAFCQLWQSPSLGTLRLGSPVRISGHGKRACGVMRAAPSRLAALVQTTSDTRPSSEQHQRVAQSARPWWWALLLAPPLGVVAPLGTVVAPRAPARRSSVINGGGAHARARLPRCGGTWHFVLHRVQIQSPSSSSSNSSPPHTLQATIALRSPGRLVCSTRVVACFEHVSEGLPPRR